MSAPYEKLWKEPESAVELVPAMYPTGLRYDGRAVTYIDTAGGLLLVPNQRHDFMFSIRMSRAKLSSGKVKQFGDQQGIYYPQSVDLITLPAILNAAINAEQGQDDVLYSVVATGRLLSHAYEQLGEVPRIGRLDDIAVDRSTGAIELLAPFEASADTRPADVYEDLLCDGLARARTASEEAMVRTCFGLARKAYINEV